MSDEPKSPIVSPALRKVFLIGNGISLAILIMGGCVNVVVGPRDSSLFFAPFVQLFVIFLLLHLANVAEDNPAPWAFWRDEQGRADYARTQMRYLLLFATALFLLVSIALFCVDVNGGPL
jgi:hypothetical protein